MFLIRSYLLFSKLMCQPIKNKSIMNKLFLNNIGDLGEAQRASYYRFLLNGISEELSNFPNPFFRKLKYQQEQLNVKFLA